MNKTELKQKTNDAVAEIQLVLQMVYDMLNQGQQNKLLKNGEIKEFFDRYGVRYAGDAV